MGFLQSAQRMWWWDKFTNMARNKKNRRNRKHQEPNESIPLKSVTSSSYSIQLSLFNIPPEVIETEIFYHLTLDDIYNLRLVSKPMSDLVLLTMIGRIVGNTAESSPSVVTSWFLKQDYNTALHRTLQQIAIASGLAGSFIYGLVSAGYLIRPPTIEIEIAGAAIGTGIWSTITAGVSLGLYYYKSFDAAMIGAAIVSPLIGTTMAGYSAYPTCQVRANDYDPGTDPFCDNPIGGIGLSIVTQAGPMLGLQAITAASLLGLRAYQFFRQKKIDDSKAVLSQAVSANRMINSGQ